MTTDSLTPPPPLADDQVVAEVSVWGQPVDLDGKPETCQHRAILNISQGAPGFPVVAFLMDHQGAASGWEVCVRVRCGECGEPFEVQPGGRRPKDAGPGLVLTVHPMSDHPPAHDRPSVESAAVPDPQEAPA